VPGGVVGHDVIGIGGLVRKVKEFAVTKLVCTNVKKIVINYVQKNNWETNNYIYNLKLRFDMYQ
jgi:hypothetical protein